MYIGNGSNANSAGNTFNESFNPDLDAELTSAQKDIQVLSESITAVYSYNKNILKSENAAKSVDGVSAADWNQETKILEVSFDDSKTSVHKVQMAIAKVGHDTPMHKAKDEVYNALPGEIIGAIKKQPHF